MAEFKYDPSLVPDLQRGLFEQLRSELPELEIWIRQENFHRWLSAGVVDPVRRTGVTITLIRGRASRSTLLSADEVAMIRNHLATAEPEDRDLSL